MCRLYNIGTFTPGPFEPGGGSSDMSQFVPVVIFIGESNTGGRALNSDASDDELAAQDKVKILNNDTFVFESLKIGEPNSNNLLDHAALSDDYSGVEHSWELQLAQQVNNGDWPTDLVYLIKAGQGGSTVSEWNSEGSYFSKYVERVNVAKEYFASIDKIPVFYVWFSLGINDAIAETELAAFKDNVLDFWSRIRAEIGFAPIVLSELPVEYDAYNSKLSELVVADKFSKIVETSDLSMRDENHWDYAGMKEMANRLWEWSIETVGYGFAYMMAQTLALSQRESTGGGGGGTDPEEPVTTLTWVGLENATVGAENALEYTEGNPAGARSEELVNSNSDFQYIIKYNDAQAISGIAVFLEDTESGTNNWASSSDPITSGVYCVGGIVYKSLQRNSNNAVGSVSVDNPWIRVTRVGNDVQYDMSEDEGENWTDNIFTHEGVLAGLENIWLKVIFAVTEDGARSVIVERIA